MPSYRTSADLGAFNGQIVGAVDGRREERGDRPVKFERERGSRNYTEDVDVRTEDIFTMKFLYRFEEETINFGDERLISIRSNLFAWIECRRV